MQALKTFEYFEPGTVKEAVQIALKYAAKAKVLAGGIDLVPGIRRRRLQPECVISLQRIPGLDYIKHDRADGLRIGALTSLRSIELSPAIKKDYIVLYEAIHQIASIQVKTAGTAVGNLCVATPASDVASALFVLGTKLRIVSPTQERTVPIEDFYPRLHQTVLQPGEIVTEILLPTPDASAGGSFLKLVRTATDVAKVNVAIMIKVTDRKCKEAKIALGAVAPTPIRARKAEETFKGQIPETGVIEAVAAAAAEDAKPITDIRSTAEYRKETTQILVRRAIEKALDRVKA